MTSQTILDVLPHHGLDQSILIAVLIGVLLQALMTEAYGWVFVGLVVPGYLASLFAVLPQAATAVCIEAFITYAIAKVVSDVVAGADSWNRAFGRDRFFLIVAVSILVRQVSELWLLPSIAPLVDELFDVAWSNDRSFSSIGLVLVPLVANMFWKVGWLRGSVQVATPVVITYLILTVILLPYTNLSFSSLELTYEDVALDFLASPKAYILLLVGAYFSARANLVYGWDFNGILVPSLLALTWVNPSLTVNTLAEAFVLYWIAKVFFALPPVRQANMEGPRKVLAVFLLAFAAKYVLSILLGVLMPSVRISEVWGFGYVLTSLLVVKMLQKNSVVRVMLPTVLISLMAFVVGTTIGLCLEWVAPKRETIERVDPTPAPATKELLNSEDGVVEYALAKALYQQRPQFSGAFYGRNAKMWRQFEAGVVTNSLLSKIGVRKIALSDGTFALAEQEEHMRSVLGVDTAIRRTSGSGVTFVISHPKRSPLAALYAGWGCQHFQCKGVLWAGTDSNEAALHKSSIVNLKNKVAVEVSRNLSGTKAVLISPITLPEGIDVSRIWPFEVEVVFERGRSHMTLQVSNSGLEAALRSVSDHPTETTVEPVRLWLESQFSGVRRDRWRTRSQSLIAYQRPSQSELIAIDNVTKSFLDASDENVSVVDRRARAVGLKVMKFPNGVRGLVPVHPSHRWFYVFVAPKGQDAVTAARPLRGGGTWRLAVEWWQQSQTRILALDAGTRFTDLDWRLDALQPGGASTPLHAALQAIHRHLGGQRVFHLLPRKGYEASLADVVLGSSGESVATPPSFVSALAENWGVAYATQDFATRTEKGNYQPIMQYATVFPSATHFSVRVSRRLVEHGRLKTRDNEYFSSLGIAPSAEKFSALHLGETASVPEFAKDFIEATALFSQTNDPFWLRRITSQGTVVVNEGRVASLLQKEGWRISVMWTPKPTACETGLAIDAALATNCSIIATKEQRDL